MSSKEHCHGCGKLWSEESPDCVFNYHKKPMSNNEIKEEDISIFRGGDLVINCDKKKSEQLKTQILQNQEDAKKHRNETWWREQLGSGESMIDRYNKLETQFQKLQKAIDKIRKKYLGSSNFFCEDCGFNTQDMKDVLDEAEKYDYTKRGLYFQDCDCKILSDGEDDNTIKACKKHIDLIVKEIHKFNSEAEK